MNFDLASIERRLISRESHPGNFIFKLRKSLRTALFFECLIANQPRIDDVLKRLPFFQINCIFARSSFILNN